jgi:hypothetical protein
MVMTVDRTADDTVQRKLVEHLKLPTSEKLKYTDTSQRLLWNLDDPGLGHPIIGRLVVVPPILTEKEFKFHQWEKWVPNENMSQAFELLHYVIERYQHTMGRLDFDLKIRQQGAHYIATAFLLFSKRAFGGAEAETIPMAICNCLCNLQLDELVAKF